MELKALILGLGFSLGVFALKSGLGMYYVLNGRLNRGTGKVLAAAVFFGLYAGIFLFAWRIAPALDLLEHMQTVQKAVQFGMIGHVIAAIVLGIWGVMLLAGRNRGTSWGWVPLVVPCPVCLVVIGLNVFFLRSFFPQSGAMIAVWVWAGFVGLALAAALLLRFARRYLSVDPEALLGGAMLGVAIYFLLAVVFMPQFGQLDEVFRMAAYQGEPQTTEPGHAAALLLFAVAAFGWGIMSGLRKTQRE